MWELRGKIGSNLYRLSTMNNVRQSANSNVGIIELNFSYLNLFIGRKMGAVDLFWVRFVHALRVF